MVSKSGREQCPSGAVRWPSKLATLVGRYQGSSSCRPTHLKPSKGVAMRWDSRAARGAATTAGRRAALACGAGQWAQRGGGAQPRVEALERGEAEELSCSPQQINQGSARGPTQHWGGLASRAGEGEVPALKMHAHHSDATIGPAPPLPWRPSARTRRRRRRRGTGRPWLEGYLQGGGQGHRQHRRGALAGGGSSRLAGRSRPLGAARGV